MPSLYKQQGISPFGLLAALLLAFAFLLHLPQAEAERKRQICRYITKQGKPKQVRSLYQVPTRYRDHAQCFDAGKGAPQNFHLAKPDQINLSGNIRRESMATSVGTIELRWPRSVETLFGRTPKRAMAEAAQTVSRALRTAAFPSDLQSLNLKWNVVFMDADLPQTQIPAKLVGNCHPGWMTPPANIYIVGQRVAAGCGGRRASRASVADSDLAEVLVHEMGHAVEFYMLRKSPRHNRMRAEGFATWFEMHAANHSSLLNARSLKKETAARAKASFRHQTGSFRFAGSGEDYARASMYFLAVEEKRGVRGIMDVYDTMISEKLDFLNAIKQEMYWSDEQLEKEVREVSEKY